MDVERNILSIKRIMLSFWIAVFSTSVVVSTLFIGARSSWAGSTEFIAQNAVPKKYASSVIAVSADGSLIVAVNPNSNSISLVNTSQRSLTAEISVGIKPSSVVISPDETRIYVTNQGSDTLSVVDLVTQEVIDEIPVGDRPVGVALSPDGKTLAISESGEDQVRLLKPSNLSTTAVIPLTDRPYGLAFTPDGRHLIVTHLLSGKITFLTLHPDALFFPLILFTSADQTQIRSFGDLTQSSDTLILKDLYPPGLISHPHLRSSLMLSAHALIFRRLWRMGWVLTPVSTPVCSLKFRSSTW